FHVTDATWRECAFITTRPDTTITTWAATLRTDPAPSHRVDPVLHGAALGEVLERWARTADVRTPATFAVSRTTGETGSTQTVTYDSGNQADEHAGERPGEHPVERGLVTITIEPKDLT
ncbi:hypothetical protein, partial [Pedococcus aerophilus]|uniref:hypothetical protein n=1 Tax=Pedococcus aerophilus TaxID=436356 RepID=UPI0031D1075D